MPTRPRSPARTALVVSADPEIRAGWAGYFEGLGMRTLRCVGPQVLCVLLDGSRCPLHDEADFAVYERSTLTPELTLRLIRAGRSLPIAFAEDVTDPEGHHLPSITAVASDAADGCVGSPIAGVGR